MSASGASQERQPHRIGGSGRADPDGDSGLDSATSGEPVNVARGSWQTSCAPLAARMLPARLPSARFHGTHYCVRWSLCRPIRTALS
jgi:hypothetical protein